jgi:hypothetical protein
VVEVAKTTITPWEERAMGHGKTITVVALALTFTLGGVALAAEVEGKIEAVNPMSKEILLDNGLPLATNDDTTITIEGKPSGFQAIKEGGKVKASYEEKDGKNVAVTLEVSE